jgi:hypothetical protein
MAPDVGNNNNNNNNDTTDASIELKLRLQEVLEAPENQHCCDCGDVKPTWASILVPPPEVVAVAATAKNQKQPMGAFCCFPCSGAHRRLGVHICFVRSITLDECKPDFYFVYVCFRMKLTRRY